MPDACQPATAAHHPGALRRLQSAFTRPGRWFLLPLPGLKRFTLERAGRRKALIATVRNVLAPAASATARGGPKPAAAGENDAPAAPACDVPAQALPLAGQGGPGG